MPKVSEVRPKMWEDVLDLYDDGEFSAIWGTREQAPQRELGVRWNGQGGYAGYPNQGGSPLWFSEPEFLHRPLLLALLEKANALGGPIPQKDLFVRNLLTALRECSASASRGPRLVCINNGPYIASTPEDSGHLAG